MPQLLAMFIATNLHACLHLDSFVHFLSLLELHSDWLTEEVGILTVVPLAGVLGSAASASVALLQLYALIFWEVVALFFTSHLLLASQCQHGSSLSSPSLFSLLLFLEDFVSQLLLSEATACQTHSNLLVCLWGSVSSATAVWLGHGIASC